MDKICFIVNSQKKRLGRLKEKIKETFSEKYDVGFLFTTGYRSAEQLTRTAIDLGYSYVVAVGGDGTVNEVINGVMQMPIEKRQGVIVGILPWGTGNDFARTVGASSSVSNLYKQVIGSQCKPIDVVKVSYCDGKGQAASRYFNNIADVGIGPDTLITVGKISKYVGASLAFSIAAVKALFFLKPHSIFLEADQESYTGKVKCVCLANGRYFGSGLGIAPLAKLDDGLLNLVVIEDVSSFDFIKLVGFLRKAKPISHPKVKYISAKKATINAHNRELPMEVDGEVVGYAPVTAEVLPASVCVLGDCFKPTKRRVAKKESAIASC